MNAINSITVSNLTYKYLKGTSFEKTAVNNVSFEIKTGEFIGLIGHTGSGKSTLIQHFNGILKPTSGKVVINGTDISCRDLKELRRHVGLISQYPEHQLFEETVYDDIAFGLKKMNQDTETIKQKVENIMEIVGLEHELLKFSPFELSGGQKRRVAIAGILVMEPSILVLDEPTAGLDPKGRDEIFSFIKKLHDKHKNTVILVSHSMEEIAKYASRVIVMNNAEIALDGTPTEIFKNANKLEDMGLSVPQITHLMKKLNNRFPDISEEIFTVKDARNEILKYINSQKKN